MNLQKLFKMQEELDRFIQSNQGINEDVFRKKGLALLIELAELANETRCFKFWSQKGPSERNVILEEYVDSIHFLLSLGIEKNLNMLEEWPERVSENDLTELFIGTQREILDFLEDYSMTNYQDLWSWYGAIAEELGFSYEDIFEAYEAKNQTNYDRQNDGY
ncbi:dimeric dUTPase (all-alpha-NTP-PPase superfamily) [Planomicrobium koreense]|uniref:Dimeric dUTPase (All-alpha-NTP-PPase superfamily) n=1 Tax=Planococcus koreensis TaxID=112331 RepID=A0A7W8FVA3_9BACL|nr:dUTP diphosphatase [Planococcus koreensis]MBB5180667.1 dimeric dUTPase (all-alpha-NTP-PPase superfamily) [Planococcus koreensis]